MGLPNSWCMDGDQKPRYVGRGEPPPTHIRHYTHRGYERCLAAKTVVFIGDSRVRYQFMHLAGFLHLKEAMKCQDYDDNLHNADPACYLIDHQSHATMTQTNWTEWYQISTAMLASDSQSSLCDCFRPSRFKPQTTHENRFIKRYTNVGEINLIYLQNFIGEISLDQEYPPFSGFDTSSLKRCKTGECDDANRTVGFIGTLNSTLWNILPKLNTTHAFVNLGWDFKFGMEDQSEFSCAMKEFERHFPAIKLFLISHPPMREGRASPKTAFDATKLKCDINVLDRTSITKNVPQNWYWDQAHVLSILNEEYNHQMVEKLCPI